MSELKPGTLVFVGEPAPLTEKIVWTVQSVNEDAGTAVIVSGMTERRAVYALDRLTPFRPRLKEPARG